MMCKRFIYFSENMNFHINVVEEKSKFLSEFYESKSKSGTKKMEILQ